jgi:hypothetical protein
MIGAGAFAAAVAVPVALAVLLGRHGDSSAAGALGARNVVVAPEAPATTATPVAAETPVEVAAVKPASAIPAPVKPAAPAVRSRATVSARSASSSTAAPAPEPPAPEPPAHEPGRTSASPAPGTTGSDEFGGRE